MYGDKWILEGSYASMQKYLDVFLAGTNKRGGGTTFGDWLSFEDSQSNKPLLAVAYYAWDAQMMSEIAEVLGKSANAKANKEEIQNATSALKKAIADMKLKANKEALHDLLPKWENADLSSYTAKTGKALKVALDKAEKIYNDETLSVDAQAIVDAAVIDLQKAIDGLKTVKNNNGNPVTGLAVAGTAIACLIGSVIAPVVSKKKRKLVE